MRRNKHYGFGYLLVVLAALVGFVWFGQRARGFEMPRLEISQDLKDLAYELDFFALLPRATPVPSATERTTDASAALSPSAAAPLSQSVTSTPLPTPTPVLTPSAYAFMPVGEVLHTNDACPQAAIAGVVRNASGDPLPEVRIWRYDLFGNEEVVSTAIENGERGQFRLLIKDTADTHYVQIVDAGGVVISPVMAVDHRQGNAGDALCHLIDWQAVSGDQ